MLESSLTWILASLTGLLSPPRFIEAVPKPDREREKKKKEDEPKKKDEPPCSKWNSCEVTGKCQYEADNPGNPASTPSS